jgi:hypothetical protein
MKDYLKFLLYSSLLFTACNSEDSIIQELTVKDSLSFTKKINIPGDLKSKTFDYQAGLQDLEFITLETSINSAVGRIDKLYFTANHIIVDDIYTSKAILIFDKKGKYINKINIKSHLPIPLKALRDMTYNKFSKEIVVYDNKQDKVIYFTEEGQYKYSRNEPIFITQMACLSDSLYVYYNPIQNRGIKGTLNDYQIAVGNKDRVIYKGFKKTDTLPGLDQYDYNRNVSNSNGSTYFCPKFTNSIYEVNVRSLSIIKRFELNYLAGNDIKVNDKTNLSELSQLKSTGYYFDGKIISAGDIHYFELWQNNVQTGMFYSQTSGNIIGGSPIAKVALRDTIKLDYFSYPIASFEDKFVSIIDPSIVVDKERIMKQNQHKMKVPAIIRTGKLDTVLKHLKINDNPILVLYKIKKF